MSPITAETQEVGLREGFTGKAGAEMSSRHVGCLGSGARGLDRVCCKTEVSAHGKGTSPQAWRENKSLYEKQFIGQVLGKEPRLYLGASSIKLALNFIPIWKLYFFFFFFLLFLCLPLITKSSTWGKRKNEQKNLLRPQWKDHAFDGVQALK